MKTSLLIVISVIVVSAIVILALSIKIKPYDDHPANHVEDLKKIPEVDLFYKKYGSNEISVFQDGAFNYQIGFQSKNSEEQWIMLKLNYRLGLLSNTLIHCTPDGIDSQYTIRDGVVEYLLEENCFMKNSESEVECDIPHDENFIKRRSINASIASEFSIYLTVTIDVYSIDDDAHLLLMKPVPDSQGYIIMCDPLPALEKRFENQLESLTILVDGIEIPYDIKNNLLRIDVNNNTSIEIVGFSKISPENNQTSDDLFTESMKNAIFMKMDIMIIFHLITIQI